MQTLYLIRGVPGAGKSSFARSLCSAKIIATIIEADDYFIQNGLYQFDVSKLKQAHEWCQDRTTLHLSNGFSVAVSNTSTTEKEVAVYQQIAELTGSKFVSIILENRHEGQNIHNVPSEKIQQMKARFSVKL